MSSNDVVLCASAVLGGPDATSGSWLFFATATTAAALAALWEKDRSRTTSELDETQLRALIDNAAEAIVILDAESGRFIVVNDAAVEIFGRSREELLRIGPGDVSPPRQPDGRSSREIARERVREAIEGQRPVFEFEHLDREGEIIPCEIRLVSIPWEGRVLVRGSVVDISDRRAERERELAFQERLRQSQRLEAIGQLTGGVAHDFNNLLTIIIGNLELLAEDLATEGRPTEYLSAARDAAQRGATLTRRLLAFSRQQPLRPRTIDLGEIVDSVPDLLRRTLGEHIEIETHRAADLKLCRADPREVENVLVSLAINARDAMEEGGRIVIRAENATDLGQPDDAVVLTVADNGSGMARETAQRAIEPFFTTREVGQGSGLGLSMVYGFAKQSGGRVTIESELGVGTQIRVYLPHAETGTGSETDSSDGP